MWVWMFRCCGDACVNVDWYQRDTKGMLAPGTIAGDTWYPVRRTWLTENERLGTGAQLRDRIDRRYNIGFNLYDSRTHITKHDNVTS